MFNLSEYRKKTDRITDLLPWAALIAPGVVLNKDGSFQQTLRFRGPDLESAADAQLVSSMARLNNALKRFGSGWVLYVEAQRDAYQRSPEKTYFDDPVSWLIDAERRQVFSEADNNFESRYYLTLQFLPAGEVSSKMSEAFVESAKKTQHSYERQLEYFQTTVNRFKDILKDFMYETQCLDDEETLTYLHSTVSTKPHRVVPPETPMYLDGFIADQPLLGGLEPRLGDHHLGVISMLSFPATTFPALLDQLNHLPIKYRWMSRFIALDKVDAEKELKSYKRRWFSKRKGMLHMLQEVFTKSESQMLDTAAIDKARDADEAAKELADDYVAFGYYTATIIVSDTDRQVLTEKLREVERVINGLGFTTIRESFNAIEAWVSSLPGQAYANVRKPLLHTLNLSHLLPFSAVWSGQVRDEHLNAAPLMYTHTHGRTPFRFVNHIGDVGHMMVLGPTGAGKSVLLAMMGLQFKRYQNAQVFIFDKGGSFLSATQGINGGYYELGETQGSLSFQPLAFIDEESERVWAAEWLQSLLLNENIKITPAIKQILWQALVSLAQVPQQQRTLTGLRALIQDNELRQALANYTLDGTYGYLLDADHEPQYHASWQCFEMENLMRAPSIMAPVLLYLFHRLEKRFTGKPTLLILDEAWLYLDHPLFAAKIHEWLKTLRKHNVSVVFATQSVEDAMQSRIAPALLESVPARVLLPNSRMLEPKVRLSYEKLGLNDRQLTILANAVPKRQYYYQSSLGNRLFELGLGPVALAFCGASTKEDQALIKQLLSEHETHDEFLKSYLQVKQLSWAWGAIEKHLSS